MSRFWQRFLANGKSRPDTIYLGIQGYAHRPERLDAAGWGSERGVLVRAVEPGSLAEEAGVLEGDIILSVGDHSTISADELFRVMERLDAKTPVPVILLRDGRRYERLLCPRSSVRPRRSRR
jgi:S1-C subfamily serine protease